MMEQRRKRNHHPVNQCDGTKGSGELHLTRKDFELEWFSGSGGGGQHRNKHDNCCRITHKKTGIQAIGTAHRERIANRRDAFYVLAARLIEFYGVKDGPGRRLDGEKVRTYHGVRNEVIDHASDFRQTYHRVVVDGNIGEMIEARRNAMMTRTSVQRNDDEQDVRAAVR
jgi:protein subunit release factor A